jgi:hypothetical protein
MKEKQSSIAFEIDEINPNISTERVVFVRAHNIGDRNFLIKVSYIVYYTLFNLICFKIYVLKIRNS